MLEDKVNHQWPVLTSDLPFHTIPNIQKGVIQETEVVWVFIVIVK